MFFSFHGPLPPRDGAAQPPPIHAANAGRRPPACCPGVAGDCGDTPVYVSCREKQTTRKYSETNVWGNIGSARGFFVGTAAFSLRCEEGCVCARATVPVVAISVEGHNGEERAVLEGKKHKITAKKKMQVQETRKDDFCVVFSWHKWGRDA